MHKICICGHFGGDKEFFDGQTIKTKNIFKALSDEYGKEQVTMLDTYEWKKHPLSFFVSCIKEMKNNKNMIILPAHNGVKVLVPMFTLLKKIYKRKVFYAVIGGWLPDFLMVRKRLARKIKRIDKIFVETSNMKKRLEDMEINNVEILYNFKDITTLKYDELNYDFQLPLRLCTFSRVMKEKGIEDAINVVKKINEEAGKIIYTLDIYGQIDKDYINRFDELQKQFPEYIKYKGCVNANKSTEVLKNCYLLLFPTKFYTEGIPGTIIDALSCGVPVIAANWENCGEMLTDGKNSYIYNFNDIDKLEEILKYTENTETVINLKEETLKSSKKFNKNTAIEVLIKNII